MTETFNIGEAYSKRNDAYASSDRHHKKCMTAFKHAAVGMAGMVCAVPAGAISQETAGLVLLGSSVWALGAVSKAFYHWAVSKKKHFEAERHGNDVCAYLSTMRQG